MKLLCAIILIYSTSNIACELSTQPPLSPLPPSDKSDKITLPPSYPDISVKVSHPCYDPPPPPQVLVVNEDQEVINETISKYGSPRDFKKLGLPGPELAADEDILRLKSSLNSSESGVYALRIRTITAYFSYNGRYEESQLKKNDKQEIPMVKGQFGDHFKRKSGGYYIRTIGYTLDENGYRQFLIDLSTAKTITQEIPQLVISGHPVGGPPPNTVSISSTTLGSLIGGNSLG